MKRHGVNAQLKSPVTYYSLCQTKDGIQLMAFWFTTCEGHSQFTALDFEPWGAGESTSATYARANERWGHLLTMKGQVNA